MSLGASEVKSCEGPANRGVPPVTSSYGIYAATRGLSLKVSLPVVYLVVKAITIAQRGFARNRIVMPFCFSRQPPGHERSGYLLRPHSPIARRSGGARCRMHSEQGASSMGPAVSRRARAG